MSLDHHTTVPPGPGGVFKPSGREQEKAMLALFLPERVDEFATKDARRHLEKRKDRFSDFTQ